MHKKSIMDSLSWLGTPVRPATFPAGQLRWFNQDSAHNLGLDSLSVVEIQKHFLFFSGFDQNVSSPLALKYHGHQFRHYNPDLGDGRGFLLAQFLGKDQKIHDLTTKGSGTTPYSRRGDGRLSLKGAVRELLASEMLKSLGVNTSDTFCIFETGEIIERQDEPSPCQGAVLTRRMHGSIRFGTFQRLAYLNETQHIKTLVNFCLENYFPELNPSDEKTAADLFLKTVARRSAELVAQLMMAGYVHAVLNTDNMNITGEVFDFGPYRFLPHYNPHFTAAYFDHEGLYCYGRQPESFLWGLERLAESLQTAYPNLEVEAPLELFIQEYKIQSQKYFFKKLNLIPTGTSADEKLMQQAFEILESQGLLFEHFFFDLHSNRRATPYPELQKSMASFQVANESLVTHAYFKNTKPETLYIHEIEALWQALHLKNDWQPVNHKIACLQSFRGIYS